MEIHMMKKLISLLTTVALLIQLTTFSAFAVTPVADKTQFTDLSEVYGAYTYDGGNFNRDVLVITATDFAQFFRNMNSTKLIKDNLIMTSTPQYTLSKDRKSVTAAYTLNLPGFDIKMNCITVFMKDKSGKVFFNDHYADGETFSNYKTYASLEDCKKDILSSRFAPVLEAEQDIQNQIDQYNKDIETLRANYKNTEALSETNLLDGYYLTEAEDVALEFEFMYDYDDTTYEDFKKMTSVTLSTLEDSYTIDAPYYMLENGVASYMENDDYYLEVTATDRHHISKVKFVYDGEVLFEKEVRFIYTED